MSEPTVYTSRSTHYLDAVAERMRARSARGVVGRIEALVAGHDEWRAKRCLNMNPAESLMSDRCLQLLASGLATRLTEGLPGDKIYPHGVQNEHLDEIEATIIELTRQQFGARFVEWRPVSVCMANAVVFFALLSPGDTLLVQGEDAGGNYSYHSRGPAGLRGTRIVSIPPRADAFEIDIDEASRQAERVRPKMIVIGGSNVLFPYPVGELRAIADSVGALLLYDAAHLALHISAGEFQKPLQEGAHLVTISTAKSMGGPLGGMILTNDAALAAPIVDTTFPGFIQMRDGNKYAAQAVALAEAAQFGSALSAAMVSNARALAAALTGEGFEVIGADRHYTATHQIFLKLGSQAQEFERRCQAAGILVSDCALTGDVSRSRRTGARLATHELTRQGMTEKEMGDIARLIGRAVRHSDPPSTLAGEVEALLARFPGVRYSFDGEPR